MKVDVEPVPGELVKTNNSAEYQVIFTLRVAAVHVSGNVAALIAVLGVLAGSRRSSSAASRGCASAGCATRSGC